MKKALVIYDTRFGNTREIAAALTKGMSKQGIAVDCYSVDEVDIDKIDNYGLLAIGGPTHMLGISDKMKDFLKKLEAVNRSRKQGFCFDTRVQSRFNHFDLNSAAKRIEKKIKKMGFNLIAPRKSALVIGREGPLEDCAIHTFEEIGRRISEKWLKM